MTFRGTGVIWFVSSLRLQILLQGVADCVLDTDVQERYERLDLYPPIHAQHVPVIRRYGENIK
jgi:hypothetical protein